MTDATVTCVDISHWQGDVDFAALKRAGVLAVIAKCSEGVSYVDEHYQRNREGALAQGLAFATYHYLLPGNAGRQMEHYLTTLEPRRGERVCVDFEEEGCTLEDLKLAVETLLEFGLDLQVTVYSGHLIKEALNGRFDSLLAENTSLWIAQYTSAPAPSWPAQVWPQWALWQHSDKGSVDGVDGDVDCNRFNGSDANLVKWIGPPAEPEVVEIAETAPPPTGRFTLTLSSDRPVELCIKAGIHVTIATDDLDV
jgi:lysozyme